MRVPTRIHKFKDHIEYIRQLIGGSRVQHERWIAALRDADVSPYLERKNEMTVALDLANGRLRPQYEILRSQGYRVYGVDVVNRPKHGWRDYAYTIARRFFTKDLPTSYIKHHRTLVCGDVSRLPFRARAFDLVTSVAAFEHFLDVPSVLKEMHRVIRPGGVVWVLIHLFSAPSGGHNVKLSEVPLRTLPHGIEPWDHLRKRRLRFHVPLNEWRRDQYLAEFQKEFEIIKHYCAMREGEHLLTPAIEKQLSGYNRDELTSAAYVIVARPNPLCQCK